jgi:Ca2+-binding EF-hand superfamily protein
MKTRIFCPALLALLAAWALSSAQPPAAKPAQGKSPAAAGPYDVVFLAGSRPVVVRLDIRVDRKPLQAVWDEFIDYLFKYADTDGDGVLSRAEAEAAPDPSSLTAGALFIGGFPGGGNPGRMDANNDGKVTRQEFADYYRASLPPFQLNAGTPKNDMMRFNPFQKMEPPTADLNKALFRALDANKDGKLSRAELAAAPEVFRKLDLDEDEVITHRELLPDFTPLNIFVGARMMGDGGPEKKAPEQPRVFLASSLKSPRDIARVLLARYGGPKNKKALTRAEFALDPAVFARLDRDGNGKLDAEELAHYPLATPDVSLILRLGERGPNEQAVEVVGKTKPQAGLALREGHDMLVLLFGQERLAVRLGASRPRSQLGYIIRQVATAQFAAADRDNNGYIDEQEAQRSGFGRAFKMMDRDGDGKVYEKELIAYLDTVEEQQARATASCVSLQFADGGRSLMDLFDTDRDGRLSLREIKAMPRIIDELAPAKGLLGEADIPHSYLFKIEQGAGGGGLDPFAALEQLGVNQGPPPPTGKGPLWFQKMDRNRDGDVSRAEFLGSDELFRRIDTDGDGLISAAEAARYEESLKKGKQKR